MHFSFFQSNKIRELVLLNSDSTNTVFCSKEYISNIIKLESPLVLRSNRGETKTSYICDVPYLGTQWYNKNAITNIISLANITKHFRVTMDTLNKKSLIVYLPDKIAKFPQIHGGLFARNPMVMKKENKNIQLTSILKKK